jgi:phosphorylcholine metabolism protein LicD
MNIYIIILLLIIFIFIIIYINIDNTEPFIPLEALTDYDIRKQNIDLLKKVVKFLEQNNIIYWAISGTMLGLVRDKGMIPWDDDSDIAIIDTDVNNLLNLEKELEKNGMGLSSWFGGYKIFDLNGKEYNEYDIPILGPLNYLLNLFAGKKSYKYPFVDVFVVTLNENNDYVYVNEQARNTWINDIYNKDDTFPLQKYKYEDYYIYSMHNPIPVLDKCYNGWRNKASKWYDHANEKSISSIEFTIDYNNNNKPYLWILNINDDNNDNINNSNSFNVIKINNNNIIKWIPELKEYNHYILNLNNNDKTTVYKIMLLYKYGGLCIDSTIKIIKDPIDIINELDKYDFITDKNYKIMTSKPTAILLGKIINFIKIHHKLPDISNEIKNIKNYQYSDNYDYHLYFS